MLPPSDEDFEHETGDIIKWPSRRRCQAEVPISPNYWVEPSSQVKMERALIIKKSYLKEEFGPENVLQVVFSKKNDYYSQRRKIRHARQNRGVWIVCGHVNDTLLLFAPSSLQDSHVWIDKNVSHLRESSDSEFSSVYTDMEERIK